ncbi:hypothetical protein BZA77DRAFT_49722 [Pyronema omphalodes]|nr:hypothetical protein BZA77DRAFT_49722 [Pyronema omphalodes]
MEWSGMVYNNNSRKAPKRALVEDINLFFCYVMLCCVVYFGVLVCYIFFFLSFLSVFSTFRFFSFPASFLSFSLSCLFL